MKNLVKGLKRFFRLAPLEVSYTYRLSEVQLGDATDNWEIVAVDEYQEYEDILAVVQTVALAEAMIKLLEGG